MSPIKQKMIVLSACTVLFITGTNAADWPMWRGNPGRTGGTVNPLPEKLHLQWTRRLPSPEPAWPSTQQKLQFDLSYEPIVLGNTVFIASMTRDSVTAYDAGTGNEKWRFYADGPIRFAPAGWKDKLYVASDDGCLYCLASDTGRILWQFSGGPSNRKLLGNERMISTWPVRGAPVVADGKVYFAAGIWPFMGIFIHAVDALTGEVAWTNSGSGPAYILQQHSSPAFAGVAPQGYLALSEDRLIVAGGRTAPAVYDRHTGQSLYFHLADRTFGKDPGGYGVAAADACLMTLKMPGQRQPGGALYSLDDGHPMLRIDGAVLDNGLIIRTTRDRLEGIKVLTVAPTKKQQKKRGYKLETRWSVRLPPGIERAFLKAGTIVYCGGQNLIAAVHEPGSVDIPADLPLKHENSGIIAWQHDIEGRPFSMAAGNDRLVVTTQGGHVYCFGKETAAEPKHYLLPESTPASRENASGWSKKAGAVLETGGTKQGYCLLLGAESSGLILELIEQSSMRIIALCPNPEITRLLRRELDDAGVYGTRASVFTGSLESCRLPPYLASLIMAENLQTATADNLKIFTEEVFRILRPYGGKACFRFSSTDAERFAQTAEACQLPNAVLEKRGNMTLLERSGSLPGSADWTHQYADAGNSVVSRDRRVRAPFAPLWFGGASHEGILPRHGHGPSPQIAGGRLFIEGADLMRALDIYTGRLLWEKRLPDIGKYYDNTSHHPGANAVGSNYVSTEHALYVIQGSEILELAPETGNQIRSFSMPPENGDPVNFGQVYLSGDVLVTAARPVFSSTPRKRRGKKSGTPEITVTVNAAFGRGSSLLAGIDLKTGKCLWKTEAVRNFRHNAIAVGNDRVFCIDGSTPERTAALKRRGLMTQEKQARLVALNLHSGQEIWSTDQKISGTWLGYSEEFDVLLEASSRGPDRARDEPGSGMAAYRGNDGQLLWRKELTYEGPCLIRHDTVITQTGGSNQSEIPAGALSLLTGKSLTRIHPMTGQQIPWAWLRYKGCNTAIGSEHLMTFRSASAAYVDLTGDQGTVTLGGFKSGCSPNLIAAGGILNAPDYTRTCTCSYQNQTSLALIPIADDPGRKCYPEQWSYDYYPPPDTPAAVHKFGLNLGAPGNRFDDDGTLWIEYPSVGGPSPELPVRTEPANPKWIRYQASLMPGHPRNWIGTSGATDLRSITIWPFLQPENQDTKNKAPSSGARPAIPQAKIAAFDSSYGMRGAQATSPAGEFRQPAVYTVRLYFSNIDPPPRGHGKISIYIQEKCRIENLDLFPEKKKQIHMTIREFPNIRIKEKLTISLRPATGHGPALCGIEIETESGTLPASLN